MVDAIARHARRVVFLSALGVPEPDPDGEPPTGLFHATLEWLIGEAVGRDVRWVELSEQDARVRLREQGWTPGFIEGGLAHRARIVDEPEPVSDTVEKLTGAPARSFARWANEHADAFR